MDNEFLIQKLKDSEYNDKEISLIIDGLLAEKVTTLRINNLKYSIDKMKQAFDELSIEYKKNANFKDALILPNYIQKNGFDSKTGLFLTDFTFYKEGYIYLQSLSSMLPVYALDPQPKENILDMCAAPGGKTTLIQSICKNKVNLTAVELHKDRFLKLQHNIKVQGSNALVLNRNAVDLDDMFKFDKILLDAPCSGSGTLNISNRRYLKYFTEDLIKKCVTTQKKLIKKAYKLLNKDGILIYSTCSLLKEENEDMVDYAIKNGFEIDFCKIKVEKNDFSEGSSVNKTTYIKIFPDSIWEGFFVAKLIKK